MKSLKVVAIIALALTGCESASRQSPATNKVEYAKQAPADLLAGETMAVAYSGFREGQHPDRGNGAVNPSDDEILEDLNILVAHDFKLIRLYDSGENSLATLELIRRHEFTDQSAVGNVARGRDSVITKGVHG